MKKVRISANWDTSENLTQRLIYQFKTSEQDTSNIEFVYDDSYDVVVFFNHINLPIKKNSKVFVFPHEPTWAGSHQLNYPKDNDITVFGFDKKFYSPQEVCVETLAHTFYGGRGPWIDKKADWTYNTLININPTKTRNISSVITKLNSDDINPEGCSYRSRHNLNQYLIENAPFIDFYSGWDLKKESDKKSSVESYRFSIALENQYTKNWITEKFYDSILYNTVPIYMGCTNLQEIYPECGYFIFEDVTNHKQCLELINHIEDNSEELYNKMLPEVLKIKEKYFNNYNLLKKINNLCNDGI
jgi:hypothetical protein